MLNWWDLCVDDRTKIYNTLVNEGSVIHPPEDLQTYKSCDGDRTRLATFRTQLIEVAQWLAQVLRDAEKAEESKSAQLAAGG